MAGRTEGGAMRDDDATGEAETEWRQTTQRHFDPDDGGELTTEIVFAIADARGVAPSDVTTPPLYECVDVPALESALFGNGTRQGVGSVNFRYTDFLVTVDSDGWIRVAEQATTDER